MGTGGEHEVMPVMAALSGLSTAFDDLLRSVEADGLGALDPSGLVQFAQDFEVFRNRLSLVDHRFVGAAESTGLAGRLSFASVTSLLVSALRLSPAEASRRVRGAAAVGERLSMHGEVLGPVRPVLAAAQRDGAVSAEQVAIVERALDEIDRPGLDPVEVLAAERALVGHAVTFGPRDLRKIAVHLGDAIHPDGTMPDEQLLLDRRDLRLSPLTDGSVRCEGRLTPTLAALLTTVCAPLAKPRRTTVTGPQGGLVEVADPRHHGQRMHDALEEALSRLLALGDQPEGGGAPTSLIVTIGADQLVSGTGHGESSDGTLLAISEVLRLADQSEILPAVLGTRGALLELGRSRRFASRTQTLALVARDGGCTFPGCTHPPQFCDRHHIKDWLHGGLTEIDNLTLLCRYHHTHFVTHGWTCGLNEDGVVAWVPPSWVDREQTPLVNDQIRRRRIQRGSLPAVQAIAIRQGAPAANDEPTSSLSAMTTRGPIPRPSSIPAPPATSDPDEHIVAHVDLEHVDPMISTQDLSFSEPPRHVRRLRSVRAQQVAGLWFERSGRLPSRLVECRRSTRRAVGG